MKEAAVDALVAMRDGTELVYDRGVGYLGNRRLKDARKILMELTYGMMVRRLDVTGTSMEYYRIGETGLVFLAGRDKFLAQGAGQRAAAGKSNEATGGKR